VEAVRDRGSSPKRRALEAFTSEDGSVTAPYPKEAVEEMRLSLEDYRRQLRQTYDAAMRAEAALESQKDPPTMGDIIQTNQRYRRARDRQQARRAASWFSS
jgi:hypothetical protein